jgi:hypothetical protein
MLIAVFYMSSGTLTRTVGMREEAQEKEVEDWVNKSERNGFGDAKV